MNPLKITASNYRTFETLDLDLPDGCVAVVGENGAGKSSIVNVIDLALFGPETRSLGDYLTDDAASTEMELELTFEHAGDVYRVRRHFSARGKGQTKLDLERALYTRAGGHDAEAGWEPLTAETQKATQAVIEQTLGLSRETFRASAFLAQGDGAAFTEAKPADRKRILADVLGLDRWDQLLEAGRRDRRTAERTATELSSKIATLEQAAGDPANIETELAAARADADQAASALTDAETRVEETAQAVRDLETSEAAWTTRSAAARAAALQLDALQRVTREAEAAVEAKAAVEAELAEIAADDTAELEQQERDLVAAIEQHRLAVAARDQALREHDLAERSRKAIAADAEQRRTKIAEVEQRITHLTTAGAGDERCEVCQQVLGQEALEATLSNLRAQVVQLSDDAAALEEQAASYLMPEIPEVAEAPRATWHRASLPAAVVLEAVREKIQTARTAAAQRATLEERIRGHQEKIDEAARPEFVENLARLEQEHADAQKALADVDEPEPGQLDTARHEALAASAAAHAARQTADAAKMAVVRLEERLSKAREVAGDLRLSRDLLTAAQDDVDTLTQFEQIVGRNGIPAWIVEQNAIPAIETEANRILADLGTSYRLELRTEAALKTGDGTRDTLDVVVVADGGERPYETFSGGERTRINLSLRLALAELLAHRRGAESRLLAIDEPEFLDEAGTMRLAEVLRGLRDAGKFDRIMLISHVPTLRDAFDTSLEVVKDAGRSKVIA